MNVMDVDYPKHKMSEINNLNSTFFCCFECVCVKSIGQRATGSTQISKEEIWKSL